MKLTASSPPKMDGWKTIVSFFRMPILFRGGDKLVSGRVILKQKGVPVPCHRSSTRMMSLFTTSKELKMEENGKANESNISIATKIGFQTQGSRSRVEKDGNLKYLEMLAKCSLAFAERKEYLEKVLFEFKRKQEAKNTGSSGSSGSSAGLLDSNIHTEAEKPKVVECFFCGSWNHKAFKPR